MNPPNFPTLFDLLAKTTALLFLAFAVQRLTIRASARRRNFIWTLTFAAVALLPLTYLMTPCLAWDWPSTKKTEQSPVSVSRIVHAENPQSHTHAKDMTMEKPSWQWRLRAGRTTALLWILGAVTVLGHRVVGGLRLRCLMREVKPLENETLQQRSLDLARELGIRRRVRLLQSSHVPVPATWGVMRPVILLPESAQDWDAERVDATLRHELGHIRHQDALKRLFAHLLCAGYWFHPLLWLASRTWRTSQEQACDDLVLNSGADAGTYALLLLQAAQSLGSSRLPVAALAMAKASTLETRLTAIVDASRDRQDLGRFGLIGGCTVTLAALALCGALQLRAEVTPNPQPKVPDDSGKNSAAAPRVPANSQDKRLEALGSVKVESPDLSGKVEAKDLTIPPEGNATASHIVHSREITSFNGFTTLDRSAALEKASKIVVPVIDFQNVSVSEALEFLRTQSKLHDPDKQGVRIALAAGNVPNNAKLTMNLRNIPLIEALHFLAGLANLTLKIGDNEITVEPAKAPEPPSAPEQKTPDQERSVPSSKSTATSPTLEISSYPIEKAPDSTENKVGSRHIVAKFNGQLVTTDHLARESNAVPSSSLIVYITKSGEVELAGQKITLDELKSKLRAMADDHKLSTVILRADAQTPYQKVMEVLDACHFSNGSCDVYFAPPIAEASHKK